MNPQSITVPAVPESLPTVLTFINQILASTPCPPATRTVIEIAAEEIFINIARYAYPGTAYPSPQATIACSLPPDQSSVTISFTDTGLPYNPLSRPDPDLTLNASSRPIGGLGIYIIKNTMDAIHYQRRSSQNILIIKKRLI